MLLLARGWWSYSHDWLLDRHECDGKDGKEAGGAYLLAGIIHILYKFRNLRNVLELTQSLYCNNCNAKL